MHVRKVVYGKAVVAQPQRSFVVKARPRWVKADYKVPEIKAGQPYYNTDISIQA